MRQALARHLRAYADWCDAQPANACARVTGAAVLAGERLGLPSVPCAAFALSAGLLAGCVVAVDLMPKRAVAVRVARVLDR